MKRILIILIFIFSCMPESVDVPDPINVIDSTDPVIPVEYGLQEYEIEFDGLLRSFNIYVPDSYDPSEPVPMLFCFHGYGSNNQVIMEYTEFNDIASEENFIVVYPQGTFLNGITHWNVGGWTTSSIVDDVAFVDFLIENISENYSINSERIYSTGMSNGGYLSFLLACQLSDKIAAIASVTGSMTPQTFYSCQPQRAISILQMHGTSDGVVPYSGNEAWTMGIDTVLDYWRSHNACSTEPLVTDMPDIYTFDNSTVQEITYLNGNNNTMVRHYRVDGGGHDWFGAWGNRDIIASQIIWEFFSMYDLNGLIN